MVKENEQVVRSSVHIAPLYIQKDGSRSRGSSTASSTHQSQTSSRFTHCTKISTSSQSQMTPPATPNGSQEDLHQQFEPQQGGFHNFLRAFYPFNPTYTISDTTVTLPLMEGDVILVHSIHTNGWADGTLVSSGNRGWLPTNYCEAYEPDAMKNLLKAMLNFWDLLRSGVINENEVFANQEYMRGIIAGVRYLLERSDCLTRESFLIQANEGLRRHRKALLSELSTLVKFARRLQEYVASPLPSQEISEDVNNTIDDMILKAFKIVTRGVRFLDVWEEDLMLRQQLPIHRPISLIIEDSNNPPTPPAESMSFDGSRHDPAYDIASRRNSSRISGSSISNSHQSEEQTSQVTYKRTSTAYSSAASSRPLSMQRPPSVLMKRNSVSHRLSASISVAHRQNLVSEKLGSSHDKFLTNLASFLGRLNLQSQSPADLVSAVQLLVNAGQELLIVVEAICSHDNQSAHALEASRNAMVDRVKQLVTATEAIMGIGYSSDEEGDVVLPQQKGRLMMAATGCVKAAGECVAKSKFVIERIGDFEFEGQNRGLNIDWRSIGLVVEAEPRTSTSTEIAVDISTPPEPASRPPPPPLIIPSYEKPLPQVPLASPPPTTTISYTLDSVSEDESVASKRSEISRADLLPPIPMMSSPLLAHDEYSPSNRSSHSGHESEFQSSFRQGSIAVSTGGNSYISNMRDSESSIISQTSTRATTPDLYAPRNQSSLSLSGTQSTLTDDGEDVESKMLEKTFAHELLIKDGQITGGTIPALIERLTTHDSTPDSMFVSTFYLTFRLFVTPLQLATALVERFDYVAQSPHIAGPVRLRVYNVFKGWLESHWRHISDYEALVIIEPFAEHKLGTVLPAAGKRLLELARKVSSTDGPLVPRLVSSMGKTSTSSAAYVPADTPLPQSTMSKNAAGALKNWKMGGSSPTILEFDPLELARQLTLKEMNIFCSILPEELLGSEWTKRSGSNAVNVRAMSTLSTDLSNLVADTILQYEDPKKRAVIIKHWIKIAQKCMELNNYDSLMAIVCSLNSSTIIRLRRTWDIVSQKRKDMLRSLQAFIEPEKNYSVLRRRLADHVPPTLPFVGMYLTDLTFVDAGNSATRQLPSLGDNDGMSVINFDKHTRTAKIIGDLQRFQIPYRLAEIPDLQEWLQAQIVRVKSTSSDENVQQYYRKSLLLEPREAPPSRQSPVEGTSVFSRDNKDKFDLFAWKHSKERKDSTAGTSGLL